MHRASLKYIHYFGNESSGELLDAYGVETNKDKDKGALLRPIQCPNCSESNISNAKFCVKCRMVLTYDTYSETLESEKQIEDKLATMEKQFGSMQSQIQSLIMAFANMKEQTQFDSMAKTLYDSHILGKEATTTTLTSTTPTSTTASVTTTTTTAAEVETIPIDSSDSEEQEDQQQHDQQQQQQKKRPGLQNQIGHR